MKKRIGIIALILTLALLLAACGGGGNATPTPNGGDAQSTGSPGGPAATEPPAGGSTGGNFERKTENGTLTIGTITTADSFDTTISFNAIGIALVYDTLLVRNPYTGELEGLIAEDWEYADDTTIVLTLKDDIYFSNGDKMTAEDVLYSMERFITTQSRWSTFVDAFDFENCSYEGNVLTLKTYEPFGPGLNYLAMRYTSVLNKAYVESTDDEAFWDKPVGTGPYELVENVAGSHSTYKLRDDYWGEAPEFHTITVRYYSEATTMFIDYENGVLDMAFEIDSNDAQRVINGEVENTVYSISPTYDTYSLALPEYVEAFDDIRVRQAIAYAINAEEIAEVGLGVLYTPSTSTLPEGVEYKIDVGQYEYNPERAKELLAEAGVEPGDIELRFVVVSFPSNTRMAEAIQAQLDVIGIKVNVESYDIATAVPIFMAAETDIVINSMGASALEPDQTYDTVKANSTNATVRISDAEMDAYLMGGRNSIDPEVRRENYENAQKWMYESYRQVPICDVAACYIYRDYIESFETVIPNYPNLRYVVFK